MDRVVVVVSSLTNSGGVSTMVKNIAQGLYKQGIQTDFICYDKDSKLDEEFVNQIGGRIYQISRFIQGGPFKYVKQIRKIIANNDYVAIHIHTSLLNGFAAYAAKKEGIKVRIGHAHGSKFTNYPSWFINIFRIPLVKLNNKYCTHKLACSEGAGMFVFGRNYKFFSNFIDWEKSFPQDKDRIANTKIKLGIPQDAIIIGAAGRIGGEKNPKFLIEVFEKIIKNKKEVYLLLLGDGEEREEILKIIKDKQLTPWVRLPGEIKDISNIMSIYDVYVNTSFSEGMSVAILEAQAAGVHCIVSNGVPITNDIGVGLFTQCKTFETKEWMIKIFSAIEEKINVDQSIIYAQLEKNNMELNTSSMKLAEIIRGKK